ncbi:alpha/beta hydrolase [Amycolatopsis cynarae]|uniref:Alpha/beta hydrolase n=1 Tax=Amycolatopsis cynarae TaxID=2995223 RepID=A0ABY7B4U1_9PSEU|nr:alpha/beta hydrolase [Amycolatopsis sp. HUAS 11-8]WAL67346.1 alpha/beta hydrolase [Amycolatopsis sp. HUAS 11-8]
MSLRSRGRWLLSALAAVATAAGLAVVPAASTAQASPLPGFHDGYVRNGGIPVHYVIGGHGPALVLLHGWPETWYAWSKEMPQLARDHTVIAVDLRGLGDSGSAPTDPGSYTALALASDVHEVARQLGFHSIDLAGHDWGGAVALAYATEYRSEVRRLAVFEAPPTVDYLNLVAARPGVLWWDWFINGPSGDVAEQLVAGREYSFYTSIYRGSLAPEAVDRYVAAYSRPGSTHAGFEYFRQQDSGEAAVQQLVDTGGKLTIPVLAAGGQHSMGAMIGQDMTRVATEVTPAVVPDADHWVMEENPSFVLNLLIGFFRR